MKNKQPDAVAGMHAQFHFPISRLVLQFLAGLFELFLPLFAAGSSFFKTRNTRNTRKSRGSTSPLRLKRKCPLAAKPPLISSASRFHPTTFIHSHLNSPITGRTRARIPGTHTESTKVETRSVIEKTSARAQRMSAMKWHWMK